MPTTSIVKIKSKGTNLHLRVARGHFTTTRSHSNYYIDVSAQKSRYSEAKAVARELCNGYRYSNTIVDTILCLDGTEVIGTCLAGELTKNDFANINAHQTVYVVTPELTNTSQIMFRDNVVPMVKGKHVLILAISVATGHTAKLAAEAVKYYGGEVVGIASIFSTVEESGGFAVNSVFNPKDLPDYFACSSLECPLCREGKRIDAIMNSHGYSKL